MPSCHHVVLPNARASLAPTVALLALALCACATTPADDPRAAAARAQNVIASPVRTDQDRRMDASRNPAAFIPFTQVKPGMQAAATRRS